VTAAAPPSDFDLFLITEGRHEQLWRVLGAHPRDGGTSFAVWAPNAREVRVVGEGPGWGVHEGAPMTHLGNCGVWYAFVPGVRPGQRYKYRIHGADGSWTDRADPMASAAECPPNTASVVYASTYRWRDEEWMGCRGVDPYARPLSVYEVHLGSWRPGLSYVELAHALAEHVGGLGFTHVELLPVMEHPYGASWGYQVTGYYAPTARLGTPDELRYLVDVLHRAGIGVILDWVPAHFPRDAWALARFDGTALYEHPDPQRGEHPDWGSLVFNFGRREVRNFLVANALYWCEEFHVDGIRVDAVASMLYLDYSRGPGEWTPNSEGGNTNLDAVSLLRELNTAVYRVHPGVMMIAEESTAWPGVSRPVDWGGLGFGFKWNMGWMHDTLSYVDKDPVHRRYHHDEVTFPAMYAFDENWVLPISHDEVVHGKRSLAAKLPGDRWQRLAGLRGLLGYMWAFPGKKLLFMGAELAAEHEWSEQHGLDWSALDDPGAGGVSRLIGDLNARYRGQPALWSKDTTPDGFSWLAVDDADRNAVAFLRWGSGLSGSAAEATGSVLACVTNFAGTAQHDYRIGLPYPGRWVELVNTDAAEYGGSGVGNLGAVSTVDQPWQGQPASAAVQVGPYATVWLAYLPADT